MTLDELTTTDATVDEEQSRLGLAECFMTGWRCYGNDTCANLASWVQRFFTAHAKMPGLIGDELILAYQPLAVLRYYSAGAMAEGILYSNGAVIQFHQHKTISVLLFVDDATAAYHHYPDDFVIFPQKSLDGFGGVVAE